ncbi:MAG: carboxypeptidase-like regulatory domain-containing protein, partial [Saprospiraceae bacterium]|nr:carboxypeptidase-like regulatory domain-containing protein [Saprospiraceae bacterium]
MIRIIITAFFTLVSSFVFSQTQVEGYAFESGNRGFLKGVNVTLIDFVTNDTQTAITDENGKYIFNIQTGHNYLLRLENDLFETIEIEIKREQISENDTVFLSHELKREPGYIFEITLAEKNAEPNAPKNQLKGALVEVFNNTKEEEVLIIDSLV